MKNTEILQIKQINVDIVTGIYYQKTKIQKDLSICINESF